MHQFMFFLKLSTLYLLFQADRERQEAEEMQKEMGLGDEDDSLVMMLKVTNTSPNVKCWMLLSLLLICTSPFCSKDSSPERRILTVSCQIWKQNTPKKVPNPQKEKRQKNKHITVSVQTKTC